MSQCPKCQSPIPETAFGLYTCPTCTSVLNVDMEGRSFFADAAPSETSPEPQIPYATPYAEPDPVTFEEPAAEDAEEVSIVNEIKQNYSQAMDEDDISGRTVAIDSYTLPDRQADLSSSSFEDVVRYAQSESSSAAEGAYYYDILLEGIDSEDLRIAVREALRDVRFGWKTEDLMQSIRRGTLLLSKLNPVKASLVVNRLKTYPLKIVWSQNGILESDT